jgi:hypothetical protein
MGRLDSGGKETGVVEIKGENLDTIHSTMMSAATQVKQSRVDPKPSKLPTQPLVYPLTTDPDVWRKTAAWLVLSRVRPLRSVANDTVENVSVDYYSKV